MKMSEQSRASIVSALKTALCRYTSEGDEFATQLRKW